MADALSARQQIVDKIKESSNILVTVTRDPSVDELSAALGLTLMLNKLGKHATAVVSGDIPQAINFLDPEKTFENTVDSLRDFIIALDKEKADHLRYKLDGDVVKIFITPYRTTITDEDLEFSQGDYNVELVLALGVKDEAHLDLALESHGRILHDATVATVGTDDQPSAFGSIDWRDGSASSLSEMLVSLSEAIKADKPVLDEQVSTALLTGIVAATDRFSNEKTSSKVMTMSAQLMAAGANQQLIATKLKEAHAIGETENNVERADGSVELSEGESTRLPTKNSSRSKKQKQQQNAPAESAAGTLSISHERAGTLDEVAEQVHADNTAAATEAAESSIDKVAHDTAQSNLDEAARVAEEKLAKELQEAVPAAGVPSQTPSMGGALNATTELAAEEKRRQEDEDRNKTLLTHSGSTRVDSTTFGPSPFNASAGTDSTPPNVDPFSVPPSASAMPSLPPLPTNDFIAPPEPVAAPQTLADLDAEVRQPQELDARAAVDAAFQSPVAPVTEPQADPVSGPPAPAPLGLPPLPDFSTLPPPPPALPDLPSFGPSPAGEVAPQPASVFGAPLPQVGPAPEQQAPVSSDDPGQFKIPGQ